MKTGNQTLRTIPRLILASTLLLSIPLIAGCNNQPGSSEASSHLTRADTYAEQGQYRSALVEIRNAIQADPDNVAHRVRLAEIYQTIGGYQQATELLEPWLSDHTNEVALPLARAYLGRGKRLSALETLEAFSPNSAEAQLEASLIRAEALRLGGETSESLALFRTLADSNGTNVDAIIGVARSHLELGQASQAITAIDEWIARNGQEPEVLYWKGVAQYQEDQLETATATLTEAVGNLPESDFFLPIRRNILTALSRILTEQGRITEAQLYNRILAENTNTSSEEQGKAAIAAIEAGDIDEAKSILRDLLKLNPDNDRVAMMLGALSAGTGDLDEGTRLLTENLDPETAPTQFIRAATMARIDAGDREEALKTLDRAIEARPNDNELLAMHGILALSLPDYQEEGVASLSKAISNEPDRVRLRLALAQYHVRNDQPQQALGQLRMAFTSNPADWNTTAAYLSLLVEQGETAEAGEIRDSLLNGYPDEPSAVLLASITDAQLGRTEEALNRLEQLVETNPQLQRPKMVLAQLYNQTGQTDRAVSTMLDAARITPDDIQPLQQAGQLFARTHSIEEVETWLETVGKDNPELQQNADILAAMINLRQGDLASARDNLDAWDDPESDALRQAKIQLLRAEAGAATGAGDYSTARAKAAEAISLQPDDLSLALIPVQIAALENDNQQALQILDEVETTFGEQSAIVRARAQLLGRDQRPEEAIDVLETYYNDSADMAVMPDLISFTMQTGSSKADTYTMEWINKAPDSAAAHLARADYLMQQGNEIEAAAHYEQVLGQQPENTTALNNLAWALRETDRSRAIDLASSAAQLAPTNGAILDTYGWLLHLDGKHRAAEEQLARALELEPDSDEIAQHLETVRQAL